MYRVNYTKQMLVINSGYMISRKAKDAVEERKLQSLGFIQTVH